MAEYEERLVFKSEAEKIVKDMERFFSYVRKELPQTLELKPKDGR